MSSNTAPHTSDAVLIAADQRHQIVWDKMHAGGLTDDEIDTLDDELTAEELVMELNAPSTPSGLKAKARVLSRLIGDDMPLDDIGRLAWRICADILHPATISERSTS
jgi:hypothetical protein